MLLELAPLQAQSWQVLSIRIFGTGTLIPGYYLDVLVLEYSAAGSSSCGARCSATRASRFHSVFTSHLTASGARDLATSLRSRFLSLNKSTKSKIYLRLSTLKIAAAHALPRPAHALSACPGLSSLSAVTRVPLGPVLPPLRCRAKPRALTAPRSSAPPPTRPSPPTRHRAWATFFSTGP